MKNHLISFPKDRIQIPYIAYTIHSIYIKPHCSNYPVFIRLQNFLGFITKGTGILQEEKIKPLNPKNGMQADRNHKKQIIPILKDCVYEVNYSVLFPK